MDRNQLIFQVNRIIRSMEASSGLGALDMTARSILNFIGEAEAESRILNISDVVKASDFGTAPTVYSHLAELEKAGWITSKPDKRDGRAKRLQLTPLARRTYAKMSKEALKLMASRRA